MKSNSTLQRNMTNSHFMQMSTNAIRYDICLEAPTAAAQKVDEPPITYLNKGQYYNLVLKDTNRYDGDIISTIIITFHDESHRVGATDYWKFWLTHQNDTEAAKAVELDISKSSGVQVIENRPFDRIAFRWNGSIGATIYIKFNCLSTDFSRIKGVKGIPLRLQIESQQQPSMQIEKTYCRIKLFRDKGAERKNKDDAKHIERQLEKLRGKNGEPHPLWLAYSPISPITVFREIVSPEQDAPPADVINNSVLLPLPSSTTPSAFPPNSMRRNFSNTFQSDSADLNHSFYSHAAFAIGYDPGYTPQRRRRIAMLSLLIKFESNDVYRAIYLEQLTVKELAEKILERCDIKKPVTKVVRKFKEPDRKGIIVSMEDDVVKDMKEEQDVLVQTEENEDSQSLTLILTF
ncbi:hypothetical protein G6F37_004681 [Rhizopus arrhizus]|nr:hypothetical protein G6F37_004681 [Rhizopus arrhizus]